jgi:hypothetical protein
MNELVNILQTHSVAARVEATYVLLQENISVGITAELNIHENLQELQRNMTLAAVPAKTLQQSFGLCCRIISGHTVQMTELDTCGMVRKKCLRLMLSRKRKTMFTSLLAPFIARFDDGMTISSSGIRPCLTKYCFAEPHVATTASNFGRNMLPVVGRGKVTEFFNTKS